MEIVASLLCFFTFFATIFFAVTLVVRKILKKPKVKLYSRGIWISLAIFVGSLILFMVFETPESKARYEQKQIEKQQLKEQNEKEEAERAEKVKQEEAERAEKVKQEKAEKEAKKVKEEKEQKAEEGEKKESEKKNNASTSNNAETLEEKLQKAIIEIVGKENLETFNYVPENNYALIKFKGSENITSNFTVKGMYMDIADIIKAIQDKIDVNVDVNVTYPLQDTYGDVNEITVIKATFNNETIKKINFDNFDFNNISTIADEWWNHPALN